MFQKKKKSYLYTCHFTILRYKQVIDLKYCLFTASNISMSRKLSTLPFLIKP